jgi:inositol-hexakisphosphate kinase
MPQPTGRSSPNGSKSSRDGDQHKSPRRTPPPPPRTKSTSLLTQGLATAYEVDEHALSTPAVSTVQSPSLQSSSGNPSNDSSISRQYGHRNNGLSRVLGDAAQDTADNMAVVAIVGDVRAGVGFGGAPGALSTDVNFNSPRTGHRELLVKNRGRGTSLERTEREKRTQELPKGIYNTNPGDTGMGRAITSASPTASPSISTTHPTEGPRAQYRSWRDVRVGQAAEKAWSIGGHGNDDSHGGQVEKSITEALAGVEPNSRSRKSSHSLRFFKEGLPDDPKLRDAKNRGRSKESRILKTNTLTEEGLLRSGPVSPRDAVFGQTWTGSGDRESPLGLQVNTEKLKTPHAHAGLNPTKGLLAETGYFDVSHSIETVSEEQLKKMPAQLLADIREHHNLTPGATKGSSFSRSIPVTESERIKSRSPSDDLDQLLFDSVDSDPADGENLSHVKSADDEEDSGEEQIASALFVPHKAPHESPDRIGSDETCQPTSNDVRKQHDSSPPEWLEEHEVPPCIQSELQLNHEVQEQPRQAFEKESRHVENALVKRSSHEVRMVEQELPTPGEHDVVSETVIVDDDNVTPTASVKDASKLDDVYRQPPLNADLKPKPALDAIELIPYRHQVGGHTTMWRFSKRAVCKQLNNGENKFYEKVEHYHPKLLSFLPRYACHPS